MAWTTVGNIRGPQGPVGSTGASGATGPQGPTGAAGAAGPAGLTFRGSYATATAYAVNDAVGYLGASYYATAPHPANDGVPPVNVERGPTNTGWALLASEGATGPAGAVGPAGPTGAQGAAGPTGSTGSPGATGATGGQGPQGVQGVTGSTGAAGAQGTRGSQWYVGAGAPGTIAGSQAGDQYLDNVSGAVYTLS